MAPASDVKRTALITGASAGIGKAFADVFAERGFDLVLTARREDRLRALAAALESRFGTTSHIIAEDLSDPGAPRRIIDHLAANGIAVDALVNNAGYGVPKAYVNTAWRDQADFLQVLVTAVAHLSHLLLPGMIERRWGRIINVSSLAGHVPGSPGHTLYGAAKAFVIKFSQSLALESQGQGVNVTALCPGFTYSEFHDVTGLREKVSQMPGYMWMDAQTVARMGYDAVMTGEIVCITGRVNRFIAWLFRHLPPRMALNMLRKRSTGFRDLE